MSKRFTNDSRLYEDAPGLQSQVNISRSNSTGRYLTLSRYIRIYNSCDTTGFLDLLIQSSYNSGIGLYYTLWLGYGDQKSLVPGRLNTLKNSLQNNPIARYTIRTISCGSEGVSYAGYSQSDFINLVRQVQTIASAFQIPVTASDYTWSLAVQAPAILQSLDFYEAHVLPA